MAVFCLEILVFMLSSLKLTSSTLLGKEEIKKIKTIWQSLQDNNDSTEFRNPVHWEEMGLIDYPQLVKHPMDLSTINRKLREDKYRTVEEVLDDIQLIWDNCKSYNQQGSVTHLLYAVDIRSGRQAVAFVQEDGEDFPDKHSDAKQRQHHNKSSPCSRQTRIR